MMGYIKLHAPAHSLFWNQLWVGQKPIAIKHLFLILRGKFQATMPQI